MTHRAPGRDAMILFIVGVTMGLLALGGLVSGIGRAGAQGIGVGALLVCVGAVVLAWARRNRG